MFFSYEFRNEGDRNKRSIERHSKLEVVKECQRLEKEGWEPIMPIKEIETWKKVFDVKQNKARNSKNAKKFYAKVGESRRVKYIVVLKKVNPDV